MNFAGALLWLFTGLISVGNDGIWAVLFFFDFALFTLTGIICSLRARARVETDPFGITVVNMWRTKRFRWEDVDAVIFDGRRAVRLLTRSEVVKCDGLNWQGWRRQGIREPLDSAAAWLEATRAYYSVHV
jgi:Bacterial PH domain